MQFTALFLTLVGAATASELTPDTWDDAVAGKTVFIKFQAPWWGHCKKMKPDWDKLMTEFKDHASIGVFDVDCTTAGKPLCDSNGVKGFPTIKHGDPSNLEDYQGGRDMKSLQAFAQGLKPLCSPANVDLCDEEGKAQIVKIQAMSDDEIAAAIKEGDDKAASAETTFKSAVEKLQAHYGELQAAQEATLAEIKSSGLGLIKSVAAARKKGGKDKAEL